MNLADLEHLRSNPEIRFREEIVDGERVTIVCYMIANNELWSQPLALECRGITFDASGTCISRPFEKFFNVNEKPETQLNLIRDRVCEIYEKRDGSMVSSCLINDQVFLKTKKSFHSDVAKLANTRLPDNTREFCHAMGFDNHTAIFEFTCSEYPVVIHYQDNNPFTLLAIRNNTTGEYYTWTDLKAIADYYRVPTITRFNRSLDEILIELETIKDFEGYVLILDDNTRVKIKSSWYLSLHRVMTFIRERDIAEMVINETIDDVKSMVVSNYLDLEPILEIERQVVAQLTKLEQDTLAIAASCTAQHLTHKEIAQQYREHELFPLIIREVKNQDADYVKFWRNKYLNEYGLTCVFNQNF